MSVVWPSNRLWPWRGSYCLDRHEELADALGPLFRFNPGDYLVLTVGRVAHIRHLFFCDPHGQFRHCVPFPGEGYLTMHQDSTVSAGPWIPSSRGGWEGYLDHGVWVETEGDLGDRELLTALPTSLKVGPLNRYEDVP